MTGPAHRPGRHLDAPPRPLAHRLPPADPPDPGDRMTTTIPRGAVTITRRQAHDADACVYDTRRVLNYLRARDGRIPRMDQRISLQDVAAVLGIDGVVWCLVAVGGHGGLLRRFACVCARRALRRAGVREPRSWRAVRVAWWYAHGWANRSEMATARLPAWDAAWDTAGDTAGSAARDAAGSAAWASGSAAWDVAREAAWNAARSAASAAAWDTAMGAIPGAAAREAAWDGAWGAAWDAALAAAGASQLRLLLSMAGYGGQA